MRGFFDTTAKCEPLTIEEVRAAWRDVVDAPLSAGGRTVFLPRREFAFAAENGLLEQIAGGGTIIAHPDAITDARAKGFL